MFPYGFSYILSIYYHEMGTIMESIVESIPTTLRGDLSSKLIEIVLGSDDKNAVPTDLAKNVIYLWRQDQLASTAGISTLLKAASLVDTEITCCTLEELGLQKVAATVRAL